MRCESVHDDSYRPLHGTSVDCLILVHLKDYFQ
jgi:hypothetical protein